MSLADLEEYERASLSERLAGWRDKYPDVVLEEGVVRGRPTENLLRLSETAQLMVVGTRGRSGLVGALLGSTSHALITHALCPVVVVKPADRWTEGGGIPWSSRVDLPSSCISPDDASDRATPS